MIRSAAGGDARMGTAREDLDVSADHDPIELRNRSSRVEASAARCEMVARAEIAETSAADAPLVEVTHQDGRMLAVALV